MKKHIFYSLIVALTVLTGCEQVPQYVLPTVETLETSTATKDQAVVQGTFILGNRSGQFVRRAFEFSSENNVNSLNNNRYYYDEEWIDLSGTTTLTVSFTKLSPSTTYYYRAVLVPQSGSLSDPVYGQVMSVTTAAAPKIKVTVTTEDAFSVTSTTARTPGKCSVENGKLTEMGILISPKTSNPTVSDRSGQSKFTDSKSFRTFWYNLTPGTKYYYRAYAIDSDKNVYYGSVKSFTTKTEPGGSLTISDFTGTFTVSAYSPWEGKNVTWSDVQIIPDVGDTVVAIGFCGRDDFRAVGIFDKGLQTIRFESYWYFEALTFNVDGYSCVAEFTPAYYNESDSKAYHIYTGGKGVKGEIWLNKKSGNSYAFAPCSGDSDEGYYANGFIFDYYSLSDWEKRGNSNVYTNVTMTRTSTTTTKYMPARIHKLNASKQSKQINHEDQTTDICNMATPMCR
jgi:hypothetical protein